ncbi:ParA family protein [Klebsiella pneumoniae]|uniref:ParA family protein n=3 Tax=Klebsiella pneumoniae TaxID=573 RepID=UPI001CBC72D6|nr:AAA family ATPase [Klebsiella pneumoniae]
MFEENTQDQLPMPKSICFFNHKGGVSKTTTAFNIGWGLASTGKKVMLVDLDSQCNLTGMVLGYTTVSESLDNFYSSRYNLTMESIVDTLMNGSSVEDLVNNDTAKLFQCQNNNLFLLPGHLSVSMLDSQISVALKIASGVPLTRNLPGNLPKVINLIAKKNGIDYIVYDLSPSVGGLNEIALMSSDYFIVPATPDFFCWQAINSLSETITAWHAELEFFKQTSRSNTAANISNKPKFIGAIHQRYRPRNEMPVKSFEHWVKEIHGAVNSVLAPALHRIGCSATEHEIQKSLDLTDTSHLKAYDLAQISDFNSLIAISQKLSKPVFAITDQDLRDDGKAGNVFDTMSENRNLFLQQFERLCQRVLILTA